jgi:T-complex protein 1 subunit delta
MNPPTPHPPPPQRLDLRDIKVVTKVGGTVDDSELVEGCVFDAKVGGMIV